MQAFCSTCIDFHMKKTECGLLSDFRYGFRSSQSTADLLKVLSDRVAGSFNSSWAI